MSGKWLLLVFALALAGGCRPPVPEQRLREAIDAMESAVEARDPGAVRELLADDFAGPDGLDRRGATRLAQLMFLRHRDVGVHRGPLELQLRGRYATARFQAAVTGGAPGTLPEAARLYDVETGWRLDGDDWRLVSATWTARL